MSSLRRISVILLCPEACIPVRDLGALKLRLQLSYKCKLNYPKCATKIMYWVSHIEAQLVCTLHALLALLGPDVVRNLHCVLLIVHEEHLQISWAAHQELVEATLQAKSGLLVRAVSDLWAKSGALKASSHSPIDASWLAPGRVHALEAIRLEAWKLLRALLHNLALVRWGRHPLLTQQQHQ